MGLHRATGMLLGMVLIVGPGCQFDPLALKPIEIKAPQFNTVLRRQAREAIEVNQLDSAEAYYRRAVERDPTDWRAQRGLARLLMRRGTVPQALEAQFALEKAWSIRRDHAETPMIIDELAEALVHQDKHDRLAQLLVDASQQYTTSYDFLRQGRFLAKIGDVDGAMVAYRKAARFKSGDAVAYLEMADLFEAIGDAEGAVATLRLGYAADPRNERVAQRLRGHGRIPGPTMAIYADH